MKRNMKKKYFISLLLIFFTFFIHINVFAKETQTIETNFDSFTFSRLGATKTLKVKTSSGLDVAFSSGSKNIATIDKYGTITAKSPGSSTIYITQSGNNQYFSQKKAVVVTVPKFRTRNEALQPWFDAMVEQQKWSWNASYNWARPTIENSKSKGTCITMPAVSLQRIGLLDSGEYITGSTAIEGRGCDLINSSIKTMQKHPGYYEWYTPNGVPKTLINSGSLIPGDLVTIDQHTMVYMGVDKNTNPIWNTSGKTGGTTGNRAAIKTRIPSYEDKNICFIARIKTYSINTSVINGTINTSDIYMAGQNATIKYKPRNGSKLKSIIVDGKEISNHNSNSYTFKKINTNHSILVVYTNGSSIEDSNSDSSLDKYINSNSNNQVIPSSNDDDDDDNYSNNYGAPSSNSSNNNSRDVNPNIKNDISPSRIIASFIIDDYNITSNYRNCDLIPNSIIKYLRNFFLLMQVFGIIVLVILSIIEFVKVLTGSDDDNLKKAFTNTLKRIIITIILLILPALIIWILNIINANAYKTDENGEFIFGDNGNPLCNIVPGSRSSSSSNSSSSANNSNVDKKSVKINLNKKSIVLDKSKTATLKAILSADGVYSAKDIKWTVSNKAIVKFEKDGKKVATQEGKKAKLYGLKYGTATITASLPNGSKATSKVKVTRLVTSIKLNLSSQILSKGQTVKLIATVKPDKAANKKVSWSSSNTSVATVDKKGKVTAKRNGTATITATAKDGSGKKAKCEIEVRKVPTMEEDTLTLVTQRMGGGFETDTGVQGFAIVDNYIVMAIVRNDNATIYLVDKYSFHVYDTLYIGGNHANVLSYDSKDGIIFVGNSNQSPVTLKIRNGNLYRVDDKSGRKGQILYNEQNDLFITADATLIKVYTREAFYNDGAPMKTFGMSGLSGYVAQGKATFGNHIYYCISRESRGKNAIKVYNIITGKLEQTIYDYTKSNTMAELEQAYFDSSGNMYTAYNHGNDIYKTNYNYYNQLK